MQMRTSYVGRALRRDPTLSNLVIMRSLIGQALASQKDNLIFSPYLITNGNEFGVCTTLQNKFISYGDCYIMLYQLKPIFWLEGKDTPVHYAVDKALQVVHEYQNHSSKSSLSHHASPNSNTRNNMNSWSPPPLTYLKLNVDAHLNGEGLLGLGWVLRRSDGRCIGAVTKVVEGSDDATLAETRCLFEALQWIQSRQFSRVVVEMDDALVVKAIQQSSFPRSGWGQIAKACSRVFSESGTMQIKWVCRKFNIVAHNLARWAFVEPNREWVDVFPNCILGQLQKDLACTPSF
ncbi:ribonuclease H protein [Trifolium medium]|uniref:Ribonuclease H protein n=1 Tax=Trifolium medium TaxID=97028 RepID=A0A392M4J6_9FABA|nr:ribonuclease H protein [Trifolium medium]